MPMPTRYVKQPQRAIVVRPRRRSRRLRYRTEILWALAGLIAAFWFLHHVEPSICFDSLMNAMGVTDKLRYRQLAMLCVLGIGVCLMVRWWRKNP